MRRKKPPGFIRLNTLYILVKVWKIIFRRDMERLVFCAKCGEFSPLKRWAPVERPAQYYFAMVCPLCMRRTNVYGVMTLTKPPK